MSAGDRGILYVVWGEKMEPLLQRSIASVKRIHPELPVDVRRVTLSDPKRPFAEKAKMGLLSPFRSTLYLDADTMVMGRLDFAFERAEQIGLACCINECPWTRRYGSAEGDNVEYNAGVIFFSEKSRELMATYAQNVDVVPSKSRWIFCEKLMGLDFDDQACLAKAIQMHNFNPFVLPLNYNYRPDFFPKAIAPIKIWHDRRDPPEGVAELSAACEADQRLVTFIEVIPAPPGSPS